MTLPNYGCEKEVKYREVMLLVSGSRGEQTWGNNRRDYRKMVKIIRTAITEDVVAQFITVPLMNEQSACLAETNRLPKVSMYSAQSTEICLKFLQDPPEMLVGGCTSYSAQPCLRKLPTIISAVFYMASTVEERLCVTH